MATPGTSLARHSLLLPGRELEGIALGGCAPTQMPHSIDLLSSRFSPRPAIARGPKPSVDLRRSRSSRCPGPSTSVELAAPRSDDGRDCDGRQHRRAAQEEGLQQLLHRGDHGAAVQPGLLAGNEAGQQLPALVLALPHPPPSSGRPGQQDCSDAKLWLHDHGHPVGGSAGVALADAVGADGSGAESSFTGEEFRGRCRF